MENRAYKLDSTLNGKSDYHKLTNIYVEIKEKLNLEEPIERISPTLSELENIKSGEDAYFWEAYEINKDEFLTIEIHGCPNKFREAYPIKINEQTIGMTCMDIDLHNAHTRTTKTIDEIVAKYPS